MITLQTLLLTGHLIGAVVWLGGLATVLRTLHYGNDLEVELKRKLYHAARGAKMAICTPGMLLAWACGLSLLMANWSAYQRAGWMHAKLTLLLLLAGIDGFANKGIRLGAEGDFSRARHMFAFSIAMIVGAGLILFLVETRPF